MHNTVSGLYRDIADSVSKVIKGNEREIKLIFAAVICGGHVLIDDVPGTGKTTLVKAFSGSVGGKFGRIQFTPDLLPSDITGINYYNVKKSEFEFLPGPIFADFVLADEINRATPKTQSGLLECMEERQVTVDGVTHKLPDDFTVIATQNPVESMGVFPLPEAQLDRFLMKISLGYPAKEETVKIISDRLVTDPIDNVKQVAEKNELRVAARSLTGVFVHEDIISYITEIISATRETEEITLGASTRAAVALTAVARALAATEGRDYVLPDDVKEAVHPVLDHRIVMKVTERLKDNAAYSVLEDIIDSTPVPTERNIRG